MSLSGLVDVARGGSYLCEDYELRITQRCLEQDLGAPSDDPFTDHGDHEIVVALINRRRQTPVDTREVAPLSHGKTVYRLAYGDRHRGATWHDEDNKTIWLLAYAEHTFEDSGDAFPYFKELDARDALLPTEEDYRALFLDRDARFAEVVELECDSLLADAQATPGVEQRTRVGGLLGIGVAIEVVPGLEEATLAVETDGLTQEYMAILFAAFFGPSLEDINDAHEIAGRALGNNELGFRGLI
ncbi:MAG: hypothetical protein QOI31_1718 [Solirubrobacterales bacterium]|jgi:hypothetical protein|nr:hypothetical protein [Solirubrobacterales bacterium]